jgi:hypothetical protein
MVARARRAAGPDMSSLRRMRRPAMPLAPSVAASPRGSARLRRPGRAAKRRLAGSSPALPWPDGGPRTPGTSMVVRRPQPWRARRLYADVPSRRGARRVRKERSVASRSSRGRVLPYRVRHAPDQSRAQRPRTSPHRARAVCGARWPPTAVGPRHPRRGTRRASFCAAPPSTSQGHGRTPASGAVVTCTFSAGPVPRSGRLLLVPAFSFRLGRLGPRDVRMQGCPHSGIA